MKPEHKVAVWLGGVLLVLMTLMGGCASTPCNFRGSGFGADMGCRQDDPFLGDHHAAAGGIAHLDGNHRRE